MALSDGSCIRTLEGPRDWARGDVRRARPVAPRIDRPRVDSKAASSQVYCVTVLSDGRTLVSSSANHMVNVWNLNEARGSEELRTITPYRDSVRTLAALPGGIVVAGSDGIDGRLSLLDTTDGSFKFLPGHVGTYSIRRCVAVLPDGRLISGESGRDSNGTLICWVNLERDMSQRLGKQVARQRACADVEKIIAQFL